MRLAGAGRNGHRVALVLPHSPILSVSLSFPLTQSRSDDTAIAIAAGLCHTVHPRHNAIPQFFMLNASPQAPLPPPPFYSIA
jgi:hypothetical protein